MADSADNVKVEKLMEYKTNFQKCSCGDFTTRATPAYSTKDMKRCKHIEKISREMPKLKRLGTQKLANSYKYFCTCSEYIGKIEKDEDGTPAKVLARATCVHTYILSQLLKKEKMSMRIETQGRKLKKALRPKSNNPYEINYETTEVLEELLDNYEIEPFTDGELFDFSDAHIEQYSNSLAEQMVEAVLGYEFSPYGAYSTATLLANDNFTERLNGGRFDKTLDLMRQAESMGEVDRREWEAFESHLTEVFYEEAKEFMEKNLAFKPLETIYHCSNQHGIMGRTLGEDLESALRTLNNDGALIVNWEAVKDKIEWLMA